MQTVRDVGTRYTGVQVDAPTYLVEFAAGRGAPAERWRLIDVDDALEVFEWVARHQRGRSASVGVELSDALGSTLVRLTPSHGLRNVAGW